MTKSADLRLPDDGSLPAFLRRRPGQKQATAPAPAAAPKKPVVDRAAALQSLPGMDALPPGAREFVTRQILGMPEGSEQALRSMRPETCVYVLQEINQCRVNPRWLTDTAMLRVLAESAAEWTRKRDEKKQRDRERLASIQRPKKVNTFAGLVPLREVLKQMGDAAPKRRHAVAAVDDAKLEHTQYHFPPGEVTLARLKQVLARYVPPVRARGGKRPEYDPALRVTFEGENPKKPGSAAHARWDLLIRHSGKTVGQFAEAGGNLTTLKNAVARGSARLEMTDSNSKKEEKTRGKDNRAKSGSRAERGRRGERGDRRTHESR